MSKIVFVSLLLLAGISGLLGASYSYEETFTTTTFRDADATSGEWGTAVSGAATPGLGPREVNFTSASGSRASVVTKAVAENGRYIFCAGSNFAGSGGGLYVFDGETYGQVGSLVTNKNHQGVAVSGKFAYLVDNNGEIRAVNISDLSSMSSGTYSVGAGVNLVDAAYSNGFVYAAAGANGFYSIDVRDGITAASHTNNTGYTGSADARGVHIWGRYLLVADDAGLFVFSLANPASPTLAGSITSIGDCYDVDTDGYFAFVASGDRIEVVSLAVPASPSAVTGRPSLGNCTALDFNAGFIIGCYGNGGTRVFNFRDYTTLKYSGKLNLSQSGATAEDAVGVGKQTAVANGNGGGVVFISNAHVFAPASDWTEEVSLASYGSETVDIIVNGRYAYATIQTYGLVTIDLSSFSVVNSDPMSGSSALSMELSGDHLLVSGGADGLYFFNINNPANPAIDGAVLSVGGGVVNDIAADGKFAYLAMSGAYRGIARVDLFTRAISRIETDFDVASISLKGDYIAVACRDNGLGVVNINEFEEGTPEITDFYTHSTGRCWGSVLDNDYAYVAYGDGGLRIVDLTTMSAVGGLDGATVGIILGVARFDSLLVLVRDEVEPLVFVDATNPASPSVVSTSILPSGATLPEAIAQWQDCMLIADYYGGLKSWEIYTQKNLLQQSQFVSTDINQDGSRAPVTDITYFTWKSQEYFPEGAPGHTDNKDTVTFWMLFDDGTMEDDIKIFRSGEPDTNYYRYPEPLPWGGDSAWEYIGYLPDGIQSLRWMCTLDEAHEGWTLDGAWHACSIGIRFITDPYPPGARARAGVRVEVDFGGGLVTELELGIDSSATDRFDPDHDVLYFPTGPGPHAYFAIDDPALPEGVGLSSCWSNSNRIGRPIRLVLSEPATVSWTAPAELEPGAIVLGEADLSESASLPLSEGEYKAIPAASSAIYFKSRLEMGWNMVSPKAYALVPTPSQIFGVPGDNIWSYDDAMGGYFNPTEVGDGRGYFVLATSQIDNSYYGLPGEWTRTKIHSGWNLIGGPSAGAVHISEVTTKPAGLLWPGPIYTYSGDDYEATEWLSPGKGYWVFSLGSGELYAQPGSRVEKPSMLASPALSVNIRLNNGVNSSLLKIGIDEREVNLNRLLAPAMPGKRNLGGLIEAGTPTYLSNSTKRSAGEWELVVFESCRISSDVDIRLIRGEEQISVDCFGTEVSAGRYKLYLDGAPLPKDFALSVSPNPFNSVAKLTAFIPQGGALDISVFDMNGRKVANIVSSDQTAGRHTYSWDALDFEGKDLPSGIYLAKLSLDGETLISKKMVLLK